MSQQIEQEKIDVLREIRNEINTPELRDRFAIAALQALIPIFYDMASITRDDVVGESYRYADSMLACRSTPQKEAQNG